jgi:hypothetical protein
MKTVGLDGRNRGMCFVSRLGTILVAACLLAAGFVAADEPAAKTVSLKIDFGGGVVKQFDGIAWQKDSTVMDVMNAAKGRPQGITFKYRGSGATAFLTQIDDAKNEGGGADRKNWFFRVNGKLAEDSFGVHKLKPADAVLWTFGQYKPNEE